MASMGNEAKKQSALRESKREAEDLGPSSVAQPKDRATKPCPAPTDEREPQHPDTIPAPAWFEEVTD